MGFLDNITKDISGGDSTPVNAELKTALESTFGESRFGYDTQENAVKSIDEKTQGNSSFLGNLFGF